MCAKCLAKALVYAVLGVTALLFAVGLEYEADERLRDLTDETLEIPGGAVLVGGVAVAVVAVGLYTLVRGITGGFMKDIDLPAAPDRWEPLIEGIGRVGYVAKGIAFALVGVLLWQAAHLGRRVDRDRPGRRPGRDRRGRRPGRGCSPRSRSGSPRSGSTRWRAPATPTATRRPEPAQALGAAGDVDDLAGDEPGALADEERDGVRDVLGLAGAGDRDRRGARRPRRAPTPGRSAPRSPCVMSVTMKPGRDRVRRDAELAQLDRRASW